MKTATRKNVTTAAAECFETMTPRQVYLIGVVGCMQPEVYLWVKDLSARYGENLKANLKALRALCEG